MTPMTRRFPKRLTEQTGISDREMYRLLCRAYEIGKNDGTLRDLDEFISVVIAAEDEASRGA